jgi:hypothetical protein
MGKYKVFINGQNFWITIDGETKRWGFYTTRFVEAVSPKQAEKKAVQLIRDDPKLKENVLNDKSEPPMMFVERIEPLNSFNGLPVPGTGYTFYDEDKEPHAKS